MFLDLKQLATVYFPPFQLLCGDNRYVDDLRILTVIGLYLNSEFYSKHQSFISLINKHSKIFSSKDTLLAISLSHNDFDSNKTNANLVQNEAMNICTSFKWVRFFCVLDLASVCSSSVYCYYKNTGSILKYKIMFSQLTEPCLFNSFSIENINLLFHNNTCEPPVPLMHNHYVPVIICSKKNAKNKGNRKHKLSSHSTSHLKPKKPSEQSSIKAFLNAILRENKGKYNMNTSESCSAVRSFSSSSVLSPKLLFSSENSRNVEKSLFNISFSSILKKILSDQENLKRFLPVLKFQISVSKQIFLLIAERNPQT